MSRLQRVFLNCAQSHELCIERPAPPTHSTKAPMAASALVITDANGDTPTTQGIFSGLSFFLVQRLPSRSDFVNKIQTNGGRVVKLEAQADHVIADHVRKDCPPGSISWRFINEALANGALPEPNDHKAGPPQGNVRPPGAGLPTKGTRTKFTEEDDRELYAWVKKCEERGGSVKGNELYKQLEVRNPRHTFQAWRDRYIKKLMDNPPAGVNGDAAVSGEDQEGPGQHAAQEPDTPAQQLERKIVVAGEEFEEEDSDRLISMGGDIVNLAPDRKDEAWEAFADAWPKHSASSWRRLWEEFSKTEYLRRQGKENWQQTVANGSSKANADDEESNPQLEVVQYKHPDTAQPQSADSLKRKRATPSPRKQVTYGRKRQKDGHDLFGESASDEEAPNGQERVVQPAAQVSSATAPARHSQEYDQQQDGQQEDQQDDDEPAVNVESKKNELNGDLRRDTSLVLTSDANKAAAKQLDDDYARLWAESSQAKRQEDGESEDDASVATGEANRAAELQLDRDYDRFISESTPAAEPHNVERLDQDAREQQHDQRQGHHGDQNEPGLPTSEINRHADQQLRNESLERHDASEGGSSHGSQQEQVQPSDDRQARGTDSNGDVSTRAKGDALTQENLAAQDEQHREPRVRGTDLPEDDEMHDQSDFVKYLQSLQSGPQMSSQNGMVDGAKNPMLSSAPQDPPTTPRLNDVSMQMDAGTAEERDDHGSRPFELPVSSPHELDQIMDDTLHWPHSPKARQADKQPHSPMQDQSLQFDTQVQYPFLPPHDQDGALFSPEEPKAVRYPELSSPTKQTKPSSFEDLQARFDREVLGVGQSDRQDDEDDDDDSSNRDVEDEIQLEMPEPEGGFGFSSSQPVHSQQHSTEPGRQQQGWIQEDVEFNEPEGHLEFSSSPPQRTEQTPRVGRAFADKRPGPVGANEQAVRASTERPIEVTSSSSSSSSGANLEHEQEDEDLPVNYPRALETQDIYNANTQAPDFRMPSPDASSDRFPSSPSYHSPSNKATTAPESQARPALTETQSLSADDDVDAYVNRMTVVYKYGENAVIDALKCTSMRPELAELVLLEGKAGKGLPADVPGVWSEEEDKVLEGGNAKALRVLEEKHGWRECEARLEWLGEWREDEEGEDEE